MLQDGQEILEGRFQIVKKLGSGAFGEIYKVEKKKTKQFYAAKIEKAAKNQRNPMLFWESKLIHKMRGKTCVPGLYYIGTDTSVANMQFHVMVMDLLGPSLEDLFQSCKRNFDLKTVLMIAIQLVRRIEKVHEERIIHRDIKPDNFLIGGSDATRDNIYIIDFGLAKCYKNSDGEHIPYKDGKNLTGTARYASIATHKGIEQSRRDDLETIGHVLLYLIKGQLPWQGLPGRSKNEKYNNIKKKKIETSLEELCRGHPSEFREYMEYCRSLKFEQEPNYRQCLNYFEGCMQRHNFDHRVFDYTWKQNRLSKDKEALKNSMLNVIRKKPRMNAQQRTGGEAGAAGGDQGFGATAKKDAMGAQGMVVDQQHAGAQQSPPEYGAANRASAAATKQISNMNRGSEFKKTAQQMLNK